MNSSTVSVYDVGLVPSERLDLLDSEALFKKLRDGHTAERMTGIDAIVALADLLCSCADDFIDRLAPHTLRGDPQVANCNERCQEREVGHRRKYRGFFSGG